MRQPRPNARPAVVVAGAPFSLRTLHPFDGRRGSARLEEFSLDRIVTVTLAAIAGADHHEPVSLMVTL